MSHCNYKIYYETRLDGYKRDCCVFGCIGGGIKLDLQMEQCTIIWSQNNCYDSDELLMLFECFSKEVKLDLHVCQDETVKRLHKYSARSEFLR